ncbi:MAG: dTMP kinase [Pseudomonadota bacterium]
MTLEGADGTGKSTQARALEDRLTAAGHTVVRTREPGGAPGAEDIRRLLVEGEPGRWSAETEMLLFTAARRDHMERVIAPALAAGRIVLCDRFVDSTRAYQGAGGTAGAKARRTQIDALHALTIGREADLTLILDLDPAEAHARAAARMAGGPGAEDRFEKRGPAFQAALATAFRAIAADDPTRCRLIDATGDIESITGRLWQVLDVALDVALHRALPVDEG